MSDTPTHVVIRSLSSRTQNSSQSLAQPVRIKVLDNQNLTPLGQPVHIIASGPSIKHIDFAKFTQMPVMFVNGSISLKAQYTFNHVAAYVISDKRFIKHSSQVFSAHYAGEPLFVTKNVLDAIATHLPEMLLKHQDRVRVIFSVERPLTQPKRIFGLVWHRLASYKNKRLRLHQLQHKAHLRLNLNQQPKPIGVSLDITQGFVEAGTVAYVAAQLGFSLGANELHLYGVDLANSAEPRFYESHDSAAPCMLEKAVANRIIPSFDLLAETYATLGVGVYNHSPVSKELFKNIAYIG